MLQTPHPLKIADYRRQPVDDGPDLETILGAVRRRAWLVALFALVGGLFGLVYLLAAVPLYTASTQLLIDTRDSQSAQEAAVMPDVVFDDATVDSQVEILRSERIAGAVIDKLDLLDDKRFENTGGNLLAIATRAIGGLFDMAGGGDPRAALVDPIRGGDARREAVAKLRQNLAVDRVGHTHVLDIAYTSVDPGLSAEIANAYGEAYIDDKLNAKYEATRRAGVWLQERIADTEERAKTAELAVQNFRGEHDLMSASGELLSDQQLTGLNGQLIAARADVGQAEARYRRIREIIDNKETDAAVTEALNSSIISDLRSRYLQASKQYQDVVAQVGRKHSQAIKLAGDMRQYERLIFEELKRIAEVYRSNVEVAKSRVDSLEGEVRKLAGTTAAATETQSRLRELERQASIYRKLHDELVSRHEETSERNSFPITEARVLTPAGPGAKSHPRATLVLAVALFCGTALGGGLAAFAEYRDRVFRTGDQVRDELGVEFIGMLHLLQPKRPVLRRKRRQAGGESEAPSIVEAGDPMLRQTIDAPLSGFAETLRTTKIACDLVIGGKLPKLVGIVSIMPDEGKTTVSKNLASLVASAEQRVLLIDADLRNPGLTRETVKGNGIGLIDVLSGRADWHETLVEERETGLHILPTFHSRAVTHTGDLVSSPRMQAMLAEAGAHYDYIFVDLPPIGAVVDARAAARLLDGLIFVVEWGKTDRKLLRDAFRNDPGLHDRCVGVLFNKVDAQKIKLYESYGHVSYYDPSYAKYYRS
ncbi:polysaccharide biosynthesis tyrosine autokinase [Jiella endophytica]|uniref:non-specific protein-tyrosine kinase n=1 Tax=Jiella endophytica TaxID=2558362 RepID=A0A4Y8RQM8_9HYPH|nr:polysaccharide biosynthesis tyrosine autokinase [Jiella endophytica]TFF25104.1 polysaccharide biosynthesis tyrosine autokinase [Jiella endophytica]